MPRLFALLAVLAVAPAVFAEDDKEDAKKLDKTKLFATLDADGDGKLTKEEYAKGMEKMAEKLKEKAGDKGKGGALLEKLGGKLTDAVFAKLDADKDGSVSKDEYEKAEFDPSKLKDLREKLGKKKEDK